ncbi:ATPase [Paenibacillus sp. JX-17]|uniref:ATPase n=1 Tax=Paenibacillus lacisoli TaxID=3064525 RepID=A0ABT9CCX1_9BACL|nr:ATPase [Paenibacillus sp. JX-17]MDO7907081.1 ATPase [Paenibacillus sp. JX-17]
MDINVWKDFIQQNWLVILVALIVVFIVLNLVKTVVKWAIVILIVGAVIVYSGISLEQIKNTVTDVTDQAVGTLKSEAMTMMLKEAKDAAYVPGADGQFVITSPNLEVTGSQGSDKVKVKFRGVSVGEWSLDNETLQSFIQQAKQHTSSGS